MSTILMSIKPEYVNKIFSGKKKFEYRKRTCKNNIEKVIVYSSSPVQKVVGELMIKNILCDKKDIIWDKTKLYGGIDKDKYDKYYENYDYAVAYEIEKTIIYNKPKELKDFGIKVAPQSYIYILNKEGNLNE